MPIDCEHLNRRFADADPVSEIVKGRSEIHLVCDDCSAAINVMSTRTVKEIRAEIEAAS